jgi:hypothetical protein
MKHMLGMRGNFLGVGVGLAGLQVFDDCEEKIKKQRAGIDIYIPTSHCKVT